MSAEHLPWESRAGPKYSARELKPRKQWVRSGCWVLSIFLVVGGLVTRYRIAALFGVLYILTLLMKKDTVVTTRGVEVYYQMRITTHYDFWGWDEIDGVAREEQNHPELVALYFSRGDRVKRLFFTRPDAEKIMVLAKEQNPRITVGESEKGQKISTPKQKKK